MKRITSLMLSLAIMLNAAAVIKNPTDVLNHFYGAGVQNFFNNINNLTTKSQVSFNLGFLIFVAYLPPALPNNTDLCSGA